MTVILATNWNNTWLMTGLGLGVVFCILVTLVFILSFFSLAFSDRKKKEKKEEQAEALTSAESLDQAAIATAVHLYLQSQHDEESGIITIKRKPSYWRAELNEKI